MGFLSSLKASPLAFFSLVSLATALPSLSHGNTRRYELTLTWGKASPDGYERDVFKVNGQFPGPLLEFNEGDDVQIFVKNESPYNTTVHYHGIEMLDTPWSDGVPGVTQIHIQPGCAFTYKWKATQHGTYFYHSHSDSQITDGLYGPLVIHPKAGTSTPYGLITKDPLSLHAIETAEKHRIPLLLSDWRHIASDLEWEISKKSHLEHICFDSIMVNGKGNVNCLTPEEQVPLMTPGQAAILSLVPGAKLTDKSCLPPEVLAALAPPGGPPADLSVIPPDLFGQCKTTTTPGHVTVIKKKKCDKEKWVMFDIIGAFSLHTAIVSIDEVRSWVVAIDGNYIEPVAADALVVSNGLRYTIVAKFEKPKKYTFRVSAVSDPQILFGTSVIDFQVEGQEQSQEPSVASINRRGVNLTADVITYDGMASKPFPPKPVPLTVDATYKVTMLIGQTINMWAFNATSRPEEKDDITPLLFEPQPGLQDNHTITVPSEKSWVDYIMQVPVGQPPHPVHVHGRHFYVLGSGSGAFKWNNVAEAALEIPANFNLINPPLRDTFTTPASSAEASWLALRRPSDNEGAWLIHCHIQSHLQGGMSMVIQDGTEGGIAVPAEYRNYQCKAQ